MKKIFLLLFFFLTIVTNSFACKCNIYSSAEAFMKERFKDSDFVISAKVEFVKDSLTKGNSIMGYEPGYWRDGGYNAVLKVEKIYKGELKTDIIEITPNWSDCSQYFKTGDSYIIFGKMNLNGEFTTNICSGNFPSSNQNKLKLLQKTEY